MTSSLPMSAWTWILMLGVTAIWLAMAFAVWYLAATKVTARAARRSVPPHA